MDDVKRGLARREGKINADIEALWELITDWGNMDWWGNELEGDGMQAGRTFLEGEKGKVPRTKVIERSDAEDMGLPIQNREVLIHEDPIAYRLYYTASDGFMDGVRNYMATWSLDPLPDGRTQMNISSQFDVVKPGNLAVVKDTVEAVYELIFKGLNDYLAKKNGP